MSEPTAATPAAAQDAGVPPATDHPDQVNGGHPVDEQAGDADYDRSDYERSRDLVQRLAADLADNGDDKVREFVDAVGNLIDDADDMITDLADAAAQATGPAAASSPDGQPAAAPAADSSSGPAATPDNVALPDEAPDVPASSPLSVDTPQSAPTALPDDEHNEPAPQEPPAATNPAPAQQ